MADYTDVDLDVAFGDGMAEAYFQMGDLVRDSMDMIADGRAEDAALHLERSFFPKYRNSMECHAYLCGHQSALKTVPLFAGEGTP